MPGRSCLLVHRDRHGSLPIALWFAQHLSGKGRSVVLPFLLLFHPVKYRTRDFAA